MWRHFTRCISEAGRRRRRRRRRLFTYFTADWLRTHAHSTTLGLRDCREPGRPSNAAVDGPATSTGVQVNRDQLTADDRSVSNRSLRRPASCEGCRDIRPPGYLLQDNGPPEHVPPLASVLRVDENGYCYLSFHRYFESVA